MNTLVTMQATVAPTAAPALTKLITDGWGKEMLRSLVDSIEFYVGYASKDSIVVGDTDHCNILMLTDMLRAVLNDAYNIDITK